MIVPGISGRGVTLWSVEEEGGWRGGVVRGEGGGEGEGGGGRHDSSGD